MLKRNSKKNIMKWAKEAIDNSNLTDYKKEVLLKEAEMLVECGLWRGDISAIWIKEGYTMADIPDLYP